MSTARILVQGRNVEATPAIKAYCEDKVGNAIKHFDGVKEVRCAGCLGAVGWAAADPPACLASRPLQPRDLCVLGTAPAEL